MGSWCNFGCPGESSWQYVLSTDASTPWAVLCGSRQEAVAIGGTGVSACPPDGQTSVTCREQLAAPISFSYSVDTGSDNQPVPLQLTERSNSLYPLSLLPLPHGKKSLCCWLVLM